jgi:hypothetical protein
MVLSGGQSWYVFAPDRIRAFIGMRCYIISVTWRSRRKTQLMTLIESTPAMVADRTETFRLFAKQQAEGQVTVLPALPPVGACRVGKKLFRQYPVQSIRQYRGFGWLFQMLNFIA